MYNGWFAGDASAHAGTEAAQLRGSDQADSIGEDAKHDVLPKEQRQSQEFLIGGKKIKMADLARRASVARRRYHRFSMINSVLLISAIALTAALLAIAVGLLEVSGMRTSVAFRLDILNWLGRLLVVGVVIAWIKFVWLDGWLFYPPSRPVAARRGTTREWFDNITFMVNEEPSEVADGLTHALNLTLRSKMRGTLLFVWAIYIGSAAFGIVAATALNFVSVDEFPRALSVLVSNNWSVIRDAIIYIVTFDDVPLLAGDVIEPVAFGFFLAAPLVALLFAQQLVVNAVDMRWSLLSSPDIVYKMLKYVLLVRNQAKDYTFRDAVKDARELVLEYGVNEIPEDFVDTEGDLFFYSANMRSEFVRGTSV